MRAPDSPEGPRKIIEAVHARGLDTSARMVAIVLWAHSDDAGCGSVAQRDLAALTGLCERTVRTALKRLERAGLLVRKAPKDRRAGDVAAYEILIDVVSFAGGRATQRTHDSRGRAGGCRPPERARRRDVPRVAEVVLPPDPPVARKPGEAVVVRLDSGYTIGRVVSQDGYRLTVSVCGVERDFDDCEVGAHCAETGTLCHPGGARVA